MLGLRSQLTLQELGQFNELLLASVHNEVGLRETLFTAGQHSRFGLSRTISQVVQQLDYGESLGDALQSCGEKFPEQYIESIKAAESGGVLGSVLESYEVFFKTTLDIRRRLSRAMVYPLLVATTGYFLFLFVGQESIRRFLEFDYEMRLEPNWFLQLMGSVTEWSHVWGMIPPLMLIILLWAWAESNNGNALSMKKAGWIMRGIPGFPSIVKLFRFSMFAEVLAVLIERNVPYHDSVRIAAVSTGEAELAQRIGQEGVEGAKMPPFLSWIVESGASDQSINGPLRQAANLYRRRAEIRLEWIKLLAPLLLLLIIAGGTALLYALTVFVPFADAMRQIT